MVAAVRSRTSEAPARRADEVASRAPRAADAGVRGAALSREGRVAEPTRSDTLAARVATAGPSRSEQLRSSPALVDGTRQRFAADLGAQQLRGRLDAALVGAARTTPTRVGRDASGAPVAQGVQATGGACYAPDAQTARDVRDYAQELSAQGKGAAEIQAETLRRSIELLHERHPGMDSATLMDHAMATTTMVLNGKDVIQHLEKLGGNQAMVDIMRGLPEDAFAGGDLDTTNGGDLKPAFDDGTNNQAFHSNFFVAAGYVNPSWLASAGNFKHELLDPGGSVADYKASHMGLEVGKTLGMLREQALTNPSFDLVAAMPAIVGGAYSNDPAARGSYSIGGQRYDFTGVATETSANVDRRIGELEWDVRRQIVGFFQWLRGN